MFKNFTAMASLLTRGPEIANRVKVLHDELAKTLLEGRSASGRVLVVVTGTGQVQSCHLGTAAGPLDQEVVEATNAALAAAKSLATRRLAELAEEFGIPGASEMIGRLGIGFSG